MTLSRAAISTSSSPMVSGNYREAAIHGRFQIFHRDHLRYARCALDRAAHIVIGLTGIPYISGTPGTTVPAHRLAPADNPLSYFERVQMIRCALEAEGVPATRYSFAPFPIEQPETLPYFVGRDLVMVTTVRETWNETKVDLLRKLGYVVEVAYADLAKEISGSGIRHMIRRDDVQWEALVPRGAVEYLKQINIRARLLGIPTAATQ